MDIIHIFTYYVQNIPVNEQLLHINLEDVDKIPTKVCFETVMMIMEPSALMAMEEV